MSVYLCCKCDRLIDGDYLPCTVNPRNDLELMCEPCAAENEDADGLVAVRPRVFSAAQQAIIDQIIAESKEPDSGDED